MTEDDLWTIKEADIPTMEDLKNDPSAKISGGKEVLAEWAKEEDFNHGRRELNEV